MLLSLKLNRMSMFWAFKLKACASVVDEGGVGRASLPIVSFHEIRGFSRAIGVLLDAPNQHSCFAR